MTWTVVESECQASVWLVTLYPLYPSQIKGLLFLYLAFLMPVSLCQDKRTSICWEEDTEINSYQNLTTERASRKAELINESQLKKKKLRSVCIVGWC